MKNVKNNTKKKIKNRKDKKDIKDIKSVKNIENIDKVWVFIKHKKSDSFFQKMRKDFQEIPLLVKLMFWNMSLLRFWRGIGINMYYSVYLKWLFDNLIVVSVLWSLLALIKLAFSIPTGILDNKMNSKTILIVGKWLFIVAGVLYFIAGFFSIPRLVIIAIIAQGIWTPMVFNTNQFLIRKLVPINISSETFWLFFSFYQTGYLIAALITAALMYFKLPIEYFFLIASVFSVLTLLHNTKTKKVDKHGLFYEIKHDVLKKDLYSKVLGHLKDKTPGLKIMLLIQGLHWLLYYVSFMFIPLLALSKNMTLIDIALIFAVMRIPHSLTFYIEALFKNRWEFLVTIGCFILCAISLICLAIFPGFWVMLIFSFIMSTLTALSRPMISGIISKLIKPKEYAEVTGVQDFITRFGEIIGYLVFGIVSHYIGMSLGFVSISIAIILVSLFSFRYRNRIRETKKTVAKVIKATA